MLWEAEIISRKAGVKLSSHLSHMQRKDALPRFTLSVSELYHFTSQLRARVKFESIARQYFYGPRPSLK